MRVALFFVGILAIIAELFVVFVVPLQAQKFVRSNVELGLVWALLISLSNNARTLIGLFFFVVLMGLWAATLHLMKPKKRVVRENMPPIPNP